MYIYFLDKLDYPIFKLNVRASYPKLGTLSTVLPLHNGSLLVSDYKDSKYRVLRLSGTGEIINTVLTTDKNITGLMMLSNREVLILYRDGSLQRVRIQDWKIQKEYKVPDVGVLWDGIRIDDDQVLLVDSDKGQIFKYDLKKRLRHIFNIRNKNVVIDELDDPTSVDKAVTDQGVFYIVNEEGSHTVSVYNDRWRLVTSIGGYGYGDKDERLYYPHTARVLPDNTIIVSDWGNDRISHFTLQGKFVRHVIKLSHGISYPRRLAVQYPYVWVAYADNIKCYQIKQKLL